MKYLIYKNDPIKIVQQLNYNNDQYSFIEQSVWQMSAYII